ncbi:hypothetical protein ACMU_06480 [Actibacterium mucosum KCTC 23349]|uniref:Bacteriophage phiJL001 Gp84 C-terminal domain-containing protein n=1 Tax=Actibacterium mucosum KCTC 23349 TaxID=1454373 RepID=A0A037ZJH1_9RHOB|nr:DUF2163 domain-containing protein [Actibacterium mucosum]KAJ56585.1 hypothetical protein ACMU_06480 [Actibacterium mucosum KCTC 23349]
MAISQQFQTHLDSGATTLCRAWAVRRTDGVVLGFTDHDGAVQFGGITFNAETGLTARALSQTTGLSVDNSEAVGALTSDAVTEADILAGRYDDAVVEAWLVNWSNVEDRLKLFTGTLGEITRGGGAFQAELRGLAEALNQAQGKAYQRPCPAVLGDGRCKFNLNTAGYAAEIPVESSEDGRVFLFTAQPSFEERWFEAGRLRVLTGDGAGVIGVIKNDRTVDGQRRIELWEALKVGVAVGDTIRLEAGCDKRAETCKVKFNNFINFQGFPHIPGEDWLISYPVSGGPNDGGSLQ